MIDGRKRSLEIDGRLAFRYPVYGSKVVDGRTRSTSVAAEPAEKLVLPLDRETATAWAWKHFEDLGPDRVKNLVWLLTRATGPSV